MCVICTSFTWSAARAPRTVRARHGPRRSPGCPGPTDRGPQYLVLLRERPVAALQLTDLDGPINGDAGLHTVLDISLAQPLRQRHLMDPEVRRNTRQSHSLFTAPSDLCYVRTKLKGRAGHSNIQPVRRACISVVTDPCSGPSTLDCIEPQFSRLNATGQIAGWKSI